MKKEVSVSILVSVGLVFLVSSCTCTQDVVRTPVAEERSAVLEETGTEEENSTTAETPEEKPSIEREHVVRGGECLWWIAEYEDIYNDPFMWPLIYNANRDRVKDPDRIYPGQILRIPRSGHTLDEIREARRRAGAPRPFTPPEGSLPPID
jgi:hypothetical protein